MSEEVDVYLNGKEISSTRNWSKLPRYWKVLPEDVLKEAETWLDEVREGYETDYPVT